MAFNPIKYAGETQEEFEKRMTGSILYNEPLDMDFPSMITAHFLSKHEQALFAHLKKTCPNHYVWPQVQLIRLLNIDEKRIEEEGKKDTLRDGLEPKPSKWPSFNEIRLLSLDYVIADVNFTPVCAIELDGPEHKTDPSTITRDKNKAAALKAANFPLLRFENEEVFEAVDRLNTTGLSGITQKVQMLLKQPY